MGDLEGVIANPRTSPSEIRTLLPIVAGSDLPLSRKTALINLLLQDPRREVRRFAAVMAGCMGDATTIPALERMVAAGELDALAALARLGGSEVRETLAELLRASDPEVRTSAVFAAKRLPSQKGIPLLLDSLRTESVPRVRRAIAACLAYKGRRDGVHLLKPLMQDESSPHYAGAVCALSGANDQDALRRLRRLLASHSALSRNAYAALYWGLAEGLQLDHGASEEVFARAMQWVEARLTQLNQ